jgi:hypothetical protein
MEILIALTILLLLALLGVLWTRPPPGPPPTLR